MANPIQAIRGMNDILPSDIHFWHYVESKLKTILQNYGFQEIRMPILEKTDLFKRTIGEATDIVEKEMYTFLDRNEESLTLRPEGTASCVRAGVEHGLLYNQIQKLWYMGPYFRYERPQKGRYRQFYQCGAEVFGIATPDIDAELIMMSARILDSLGLRAHVKLELNSLGSTESRQQYRSALVDYLNDKQEQLDEDSLRRLVTNPLRILDSKNPSMQGLIAGAPTLLEYLDTESKDHFLKLQDYLNAAHVAFTINPCLVRGLDYYTKTVFEWVTTDLGAQGTVCAGGRYDGLVEQLGGKATPALGFAIGMERLILLTKQFLSDVPVKKPDIYVMSDSDTSFQKALVMTESIRNHFPNLFIQQNCGGSSLKNQFKKADKQGAQYALILGEQEFANESITIKSLRDNSLQTLVQWENLNNFLSEHLFKIP